MAEAIASPSESEKPLLAALCAAAETEFSARLRSGITPADCGSAFPCAAALLAVAGLLPCRCSETMTEFRAGDVQIKGGGGCEASAALRNQAARLLAPYCSDDQFAFLGVRG